MNRTSHTIRTFALSLLMLVAAASSAVGQSNFSASPSQVTPSNDTGVRAFQTYSGVRENINLSNGNLNLDIPILSLPGRNGLNLSLSVQYDSKIWVPHSVPINSGADLMYQWKAEKSEPRVGDVGWRLSWPTISAGRVIDDDYGNMIGMGDTLVTLADGGKHSLGAYHTSSGTDRTPIAADRVMDSEDGSFLQINRANPSDIVVRTKDGTAIHFPGEESGATKIEDTNGNYIDWTTPDIIDTLGRHVVVDASNPDIETIAFQDANGNYTNANGVKWTRVTLNFTSITLFSSAYPNNNPFSAPVKQNCGGATICHFYVWVSPPPMNYPVRMLTSILLPDNTAYTFQYNDYGELTKITYPTGGYTAYGYSARGQFVHKEYFWEPAGLNVTSDFREVLSKRVCANALACSAAEEEVTTYAPHIGQYDANNSSVDVIAPTGEKTTVQFTSTVPDDGYAKYFSPRETLRTIYKENSSDPFKTVQTEYNSLDISAAPYLPTRVTTTLFDASPALVSKVETDYDTYSATVQWPPAPGGDPGYQWTFNNQSAQPRTRYIDNATQQREYDFGGATPLRTTNIAWANATTAPSLWSAHIWDRMLLQGVHAGAAAASSSVNCLDGVQRVACTQFEYDNYTGGLASSGAATGHETPSVRGNLTASSRWRDSDGGTQTNVLLTSRNQYDDAGNIVSATDPRGDQTMFKYSGAYQAAYVTEIDYPDTSSPNLAHHKVTLSYDFNTGLKTRLVDMNLQSTSFVYDNMRRLVYVGNADGGYSQIAYFPYTQGEGGLNVVRRWDYQSSSAHTDSQIGFDALGRQVRQKTLNGEGSWDQADSCYDSRGLVYFRSYVYQGTGFTSSPVCAGSSPLFGDGFSYDVHARPTAVIHGDGSQAITAYAGRATSVTDEGNGTVGVQRVSQVDVLGRLTGVCEASSQTLQGSTGTPSACGLDLAATGFKTSYQYDLLGNLIRATQSGLADRTFTYNALGELLSAFNPESGSVNYTYDADGNVLTRTRPKPNNAAGNVTTSYAYDPMHRLAATSYSPAGYAPNLAFNYDEPAAWGAGLSNTNGRKSSELAAGTAYARFSYDPVGRIKLNDQCTPRTCGSSSFYSTAYTYDWQGNPLTATDGVGTTYSAGYNVANRITGFNSTLGGTQRTLLSNGHYGPFGLTSLNINGSVLAETRGYQNNRGFLSSVSVAQGTTNRYNVALTFAPNGDVLAGNDSVNGNWAYTYDPMNRLLTASKNSGATAYRYDYDRFGNRWHQNLTAGTGTTRLLTFNNQLNRVDSAGYAYDALGNLLSDGTHTYQYDEESRLISIDKPSAPARDYQYDAEGRRIKNSYSSSEYLYDLGEHAITVLDSNTGAWLRGEAFAGGRHVATFTNSGNTVVFAHSDWLGTERVRTQTDGSEFPNSRWTSGPWGDDGSSAPNPSADHFTGKERDTETGLDYFGARYFSSIQSRWMSPDWADKPISVPYAEFGDPQSLNLYGYVGNNPLAKADADGHSDAGTKMNQCQHDDSCRQQQQKYDEEHPIQPIIVLGAWFGGVLIGVPQAIEIIAPTIPDANKGHDSGNQNPDSSAPSEPYDRKKHYGNTPTNSDRREVGGESVDHDPPLVKRYYEGDPAHSEAPGYQQTPGARRDSANDRTRMKPSTKAEQNQQGGRMSQYSKEKKKEFGFDKNQ